MGLYEPINPDRDTLPTMTLREPKQLEQEKIVIKNLRPLLELANFNELSQKTIQYALAHHDPLYDTQVNVNIDDYEYMMFWALGLRKGVTPLEMKELQKISGIFFFRRHVKLPEQRWYCKRMVLVARVRTGRMVLKSFKDIPLENLEQLLPAVALRISARDRTLLLATLVTGGCALLVNLLGLGLWPGLGFSLPILILPLALFAVLMTDRAVRVFRRKREQKALNRSLVLYHKSTSNNVELLVTLAHRAQQEHVKEVLLAHVFHPKPFGQHRHHGSDEEMAAQLSHTVSQWLHEQTCLPISFKGSRALQRLRELEEALTTEGGDGGREEGGAVKGRERKREDRGKWRWERDRE
ncbi:transmembrane protein 143-like [Leucoraja erinacea]|uniref:transmembrane protein 143-like n=1 Tax=Leucoraja erinaceus TaxID=7782 RepID=UPI0024551E5B|nr:transmembrane protein 143-like [Leucoraja erinacea]